MNTDSDSPSVAKLSWVTLAILLLPVCLYLVFRMNSGWVPHDDGLLAQMAERVRSGELAHRDFYDPYTGLLNYLHAGYFAAFGESLLALRMGFLCCALLWIGCCYFVLVQLTENRALRLAGIWAIAVSAMPKYFVPMPSWYNLMLTTVGLAILLKARGRLGWFFLAGVCGGLSVLVKITGLLFVGAVAGYGFLRTAALHPAASSEPRSVNKAALLSIIGLSVWTLVALGMFSRFGPSYLIHFSLPLLLPALLGLLFVSRNWSVLTFNRNAAIMVAVFLAGVCAPLLLFGAYYAYHGQLEPLLQAITLKPFSRLEAASVAPVSYALTVPIILCWLYIAARGPRIFRNGYFYALTILSILHIGITLYSEYESDLWRHVLECLSLAIPLGAFWKLREREATISDPVLMLFCMSCFLSLTRFPFSYSIYSNYTLAIHLMLLIALSSEIGLAFSKHVLYSVTIFSLVVLGYREVIGTETHHISWHPTRLLEVPRGQILVPAVEADWHEKVVEAMLPPGELVAFPDCPQIYFLSGKRNLTATLYEFLDGSSYTPETLELLERKHDLRYIVINHQPDFSSKPSDATIIWIAERFPDHQSFGPFTVYVRR